MGETLAAAALLAAAACSSGETKREEDPELLDRAAADLLAEHYSSAAFKYEQYLSRHPETAKRPWILSQVGLCRNGQGDYEGAVRTFDQALGARPDDTLRLQIRYRRAIALNFLDRPDGALSDLQEIEAAPRETRESAVKSAEFLRILGVTQIRAGLWPSGRKTLQALVDQFPHSQEAAVVKPLIALKSFTVQVSSATDEKAAKAKVADFQKKGLLCRVLSLPERNPAVVTGDFATYADAVKERSRLKAIGVDGFILP